MTFLNLVLIEVHIIMHIMFIRFVYYIIIILFLLLCADRSLSISHHSLFFHYSVASPYICVLKHSHVSRGPDQKVDRTVGVKPEER